MKKLKLRPQPRRERIDLLGEIKALKDNAKIQKASIVRLIIWQEAIQQLLVSKGIFTHEDFITAISNVRTKITQRDIIQSENTGTVEDNSGNSPG